MQKYIKVNKDVYVRDTRTGVLRRVFVADMDVTAQEIHGVARQVDKGVLEYYDFEKQEAMGKSEQPELTVEVFKQPEPVEVVAEPVKEPAKPVEVKAPEVPKAKAEVKKDK